MQVLTSPRNALLKEVRKAALRGGLTDAGLCVAEGFHLLEEALRSRCEIHAIIAAERALPEVERRLQAQASQWQAKPPAPPSSMAATRQTSRGHPGGDAALSSRQTALSAQLCSAENPRGLQGIGHLAPRGETSLPDFCRGLLRSVPDAVFETLSSTEATQGVIALVRPPSWSLDDLFGAPALVVALDGVQDPGNAGTVIRAAEAFGATGVVLLKGSVNPYNPKCLRASAGSLFRVPLAAAVEEEQFMDEVARRKPDLYALTPAGGVDIGDCPLERDCVLVAGSEGRGVSEPLRARASQVRIPTLAVESLNAAMAAGIALYEARRKRMAARTAES